MSKRIRNFIMTFAIAILGLVILPIKTYALPYINLNYSQAKDIMDTYFYDMDKIIDYLNEKYDSTYDYFISSSLNNTDGYTKIYISQKGNNLTNLGALSYSDGSLNSMILSGYSSIKYGLCEVYANNFNDAKTKIDKCFSRSLSNYFKQQSFYLPYDKSGENYIFNYTRGTRSLLVYSNNDIYNNQVYNGVDEEQQYDFYLEGNLYTSGDIVPTYWDWLSMPKEFVFRTFHDGLTNELRSLNFNFNLDNLYNDSIGKDLKIKLEITNYEDIEKVIESLSYNVFYKNKDTGFYEKTDFNYFPLSCEYVEEEHSLYLIFSNNLNKELYLYDGVRFSVNFKNSSRNNLNIYTNVDYGVLELFTFETEYFPGYQKILISSQYKDYVISASESKSFNIIAKRENILNLTEGDLIVFKYDFSTPIYSSDTFEILNEGITLSPYPWASYNGTYNDYVEFYVTLDYINNKIVLIRNNHNEDFYIWVPYDVNISPVKNDGSFDLVIPDNGKVDGNTSSNNKDYTKLPSIGDENFFSYMKKGISSFTGNISYIFQSVSNIFNGFSEGLQTFFITIFFLSLALFIIRFLF